MVIINKIFLSKVRLIDLILYKIFAIIFLLLLTSCTKVNQVELHKKAPITNKSAIQATAPSPTPIKVALLLPLSGSAKNLGASMLDVSYYALFNANESLVILSVFDSSDNVNTAKIAASEALKQGCKIIIGPMFADATDAIFPMLKNVNLISFSNNASIAKKNIFLLGFNPEEQVTRVINYAVEKGNIKEFYALLPDNAYGKIIDETLKKSLLEKDISANKIEFYDEKNENLSQIIQNIVQTINSSNDPSVKKAVFIAEGGEKLVEIITKLQENGLNNDDIKLIGTGQWDDEATKNIKFLKGAWFASSLTDERKAFEQIFESKYNYKMPRIATLAYDAVALAVNLVSQKDFSSTAITNPRGFMGIDGIFRFNSQGIAERGLSIIEIDNNTFKIIDPAPKAFN
jgi:ABC-type branched-subunit amino acid transport system substrate-binding protein